MQRGMNFIPMLMVGTSVILGCSEDSAPPQPRGSEDRPHAVPEFAWASNSWQSHAPLPTERAKHSAGVLNNAAGEPTGPAEPFHSHNVHNRARRRDSDGKKAAMLACLQRTGNVSASTRSASYRYTSPEP